MLPPSFTLDDLSALASIVDDDSADGVKGETPATTSPARVARTSRRPVKPKRSVLSREDQRRRRLDRERLRTQRIKICIEQLRRDLAALTVTRDETMRRREHPGRLSPELLQSYKALIKRSDELYALQLTQETALHRAAMATTAVELLAGTANRFRVVLASDTAANTVVRRDEGQSLFMDPITLFETLVQDEPLTPSEAEMFVGASCEEMSHSLAQLDWVYGFTEFGGGLKGGRRITGTLLEFRLVKRLPGVGPRELMEKTWDLLTNLEEYQRIQPQTTQLRVLQRVSDSSWVVGFAVGKRYSLTLVGRTAVPGGFVVTFRSLPLTRRSTGTSEFARQRFLESETGGLYVNTFSWYNFTAHSSATSAGGVDCDVVFGGTARNIHPEYLNQLQFEVVAGFARWQAAVGFPHVLFMEPLNSTS